jgi:DNA-binding response OmpR family regulator
MRAVTILLFEHEPVISLDLKMELALLGCTVFQVQHVSEIAETCQQHLPDLALINFRQDQLSDGMSLARTLRVRFQMKVLLVTGARPSDLASAPDFYAGQEVLYKPFSRLQLRKALIKLFRQLPTFSLP